MNSYRKDFNNIPPSHTIKDSPDYIPINGHFINGFIAGDGSLNLRTKVKFGSMVYKLVNMLIINLLLGR